jgi:hypothetical protein
MMLDAQETITASEAVANNKPILESFPTILAHVPPVCHNFAAGRSVGGRMMFGRVFWQIKLDTAHHTPTI